MGGWNIGHAAGCTICEAYQQMDDGQAKVPHGGLQLDCWTDLDLQQLQITFEGLSKAEMASLDASECLGQCPLVPDLHEVHTVPFQSTNVP